MNEYAAEVERINGAVSEQNTLIQQIKTVLNGKSAGGSAPGIEPLDVTENGTYTAPNGVDGYSPVVVNVPVPDGYIKPSGEKEITENGTHDVAAYASVNVNVAGGGGISADDIASCTIEGDINLTATTIKQGAFWGNGGITSLNAPYATTIGQYALQSCGSMVRLSAPKVTSIGTYGLAYCYDLAKLDFPKLATIGTYGFYNCSGVQGDLVFPELTGATTQCFSRMSNITSIDLPACNSIADQSFRYCSKLTTLILRSTTLCTLGNINTFYNTPFASGKAGGKLYVPSALVESYKTASKWSTILGYATNEIRALEDYTVDGTITGALDATKI